MRYIYTIIAGTRGKPRGVVGSYPTKKAAISALPRYASYMRRDRVSENEYSRITSGYIR